jgi:hypothetical protein
MHITQQYLERVGILGDIPRKRFITPQALFAQGDNAGDCRQQQNKNQQDETLMACSEHDMITDRCKANTLLKSRLKEKMQVLAARLQAVIKKPFEYSIFQLLGKPVLPISRQD